MDTDDADKVTSSQASSDDAVNSSSGRLGDSVPFDVAHDALASDYLDRLAVIVQALSGSTKTSDKDLNRLHEDAMARRAFLGLFDQGLRVDDGDRKGKGKEKAARSLISLPRLLDLDEGEMSVWRGWRPQEDDVVLVYLSEGRGYWPGKVVVVAFCISPIGFELMASS